MNQYLSSGTPMKSEQRKGQRRALSVVEVLSNAIVGFLVAWSINYYAAASLSVVMSSREALWITVACTVASILRGYFMRRFFNWLEVR